MDVYQTIEYVKANMRGRIADEQNNTAAMAKTTLCDGDHLEIGSMHGGSAIVVALLKKHHGFSGRVVCVDPLDGYYIGTRYENHSDPVSNVPVSLETIQANIQRFNVDIEVIQAKSNPFPLYGRTFATAYIDGDHWHDAPMIDFINAAMVTTTYITFDNCGTKWPDVLKACHIAEQTWIPYRKSGITCIVRHP